MPGRMVGSSVCSRVRWAAAISAWALRSASCTIACAAIAAAFASASRCAVTSFAITRWWSAAPSASCTAEVLTRTSRVLPSARRRRHSAERAPPSSPGSGSASPVDGSSRSRQSPCTSTWAGRPAISHSARLTASQRPSRPSRPTPIGASSNAVLNRRSLASRATVFSCSSTNTATFERRMAGSYGLTTKSTAPVS